MSIAKELVMNKVYEIPDDLQDELEVLEGVYKLLKLERSKRSAETECTLSTNDVRKYFLNRHKKKTALTVKK